MQSISSFLFNQQRIHSHCMIFGIKMNILAFISYFFVCKFLCVSLLLIFLLFLSFMCNNCILHPDSVICSVGMNKKRSHTSYICMNIVHSIRTFVIHLSYISAFSFFSKKKFLSVAKTKRDKKIKSKKGHNRVNRKCNSQR